MRTRPPLLPDVPCETQEPPDLRSIPRGAPTAIPNARGSQAREAKAQASAAAILRRTLARSGSDRKVSNRAATLADIRKIAARTGLSKQLERVLQSERRP